MGSVRRQITIHRPPEEVWARVGDAAGLHTWFPGLAECTVDGTSRIVTTVWGLPLPEEIVTLDHLQRRFQYRLLAPMISEHLGTIDVIALEDGNTLVVYSTDCRPDPVALVIGGATGNALVELRRQLETGDTTKIERGVS